MNRTSILLLLSAVLLALPACGQERKGLPIKPRETKLKVFLLQFGIFVQFFAFALIKLILICLN